MSKPKFVIYRDAVGEYRWHLKASNGEIVAVSEGYTTKYDAIRSAGRVKDIAWEAATFSVV